MTRNLGDEDQIKIQGDEFLVSINDTMAVKVSTTDAILASPLMSASVSTPILSASTATATIGETQHFVLADATAAEMGLTLPAVATVVGRCYTVKKVDGSANAVLLSGSSAAATVDGSAFVTVDSENESVTVQSDGNMYHVIAIFSGGLSV